MQFTELLFLLAVAVLLLSLLLPWPILKPRRSAISWICFATLLISLLIDGYRWQMIPLYVVYLILVLSLLKKSPTHIVFRILSVIPVALLMGLGIFLALQFPIVVVPTPSGEYAVGSFDYYLTDESRTERYAPGQPRRIAAKVYYPVNAEEAAGYPVAPFWSEMHEGGNDPLSLFFGYLSKVDSNSHLGAPISTDEKFPLLVFNPGGALFTADQNTLVIEELVSNGYVVVAIGHSYENRTTFPDIGTIRTSTELPNDIALDDPQPPSMLDIYFGNMELWPAVWGTRDRELFNTINQILQDFISAETHAERQVIVEAAISSGALDSLGAALTPRALTDVLILMTQLTLSNQTWLTDTIYLLDNIATLNREQSGFLDSVNYQNVGIFGMSQGGSVAAEFCKVDERCIAGANMDGTEYHMAWDRPVPKPFLKFHHEGSLDNDFSLLPPIADFYHLTVKNTVHMDFIDLSYFLPVLKTFGMSGGIGGERMHQLLGSVLLDYFDAYIKQLPTDLDFSRYQEISVRDVN